MNRIGIIGGSGLYDLPGLTDTQWVQVDTPWGRPSDEVFLGTLGGVGLAFLPRHGRGHRIPPSEVNYRANIAALKQLGVADVLSLSAVGVSKPAIMRSRVVLPQPEGPSSAKISPLAMSRLTWSTARLPPP